MEKRTYNWTWLFRLPYRCDPHAAVGVFVQKLLVGLFCVLWIVLEAGFIDGIYACRKGQVQWQELCGYMAAMLGIIVCKRMGYSYGRRQTERCQNKAVYQIQSEIVKKCARVPYRLLEDKAFQELKIYLEDNLSRSCIWYIMQYSGNIGQGLIRILGFYVLICTQDMRIGLLLAATTIPLFFFYFKSVQEMTAVQTMYGKALQRERYLSEILCGRDSIQERALFAYTEHINRRWQEQKQQVSDTILGAAKREWCYTVGEEAIFYLILLLAELFLIALFAGGELSLGMFIALVLGSYAALTQSVHGANQTLGAVEKGLLFLRALTSLANLPEKEGGTELPVESGEEFETLEFSHVAFRYPRTGRYVLKDVSITLKKGGHYALVGENGSGKTTLAKLLTGLYDSYEGSILLNGKELKEYEPGQLKAMFGGIYQDSARYEDTVENNIRIGDVLGMEKSRNLGSAQHAGIEDGADTAAGGRKPEACAEKAGLKEIVEKLPKGLRTPLGNLTEDSTELSDGQWQRIFMARLLMNPADFWILDEPAAALDPISESRLYEQFRKIRGDRTILSISHRLGSVKSADCIFVLEAGRISEQGTHEELLRQRGLYARMYDSQKNWIFKSHR